MRKIALLFPGQGSQKTGMGRKLYDQFAAARDTFEEANEALGFDLSRLCFQGTAAELKMTEIAQPAILTASVAAYRVFKQQHGVEPAFLAGHSLGEFSALVAAGSIRFADAVQIVHQRGKFMQNAVAAGSGMMAAIGGIDEEQLAAWCLAASGEQHLVAISNYNAPDQIVVSGHQPAVEALGQRVQQAGGRYTPLNVSAPFHSSIMHSAAVKLQEELVKYTFADAQYPIISNVTALPYTQNALIVDLLTEQMTAAVQWTRTMSYLEQQGVTTVIELGPQTVLKKLAARNTAAIEAFSYDLDEDIKQLETLLDGAVPSLQGERMFIGRCLGIAVCVKNWNDNEQEYQSGVIEPYQQLLELEREVEQAGGALQDEQRETAVRLLWKILHTKKAPVAECEMRWKQLMDDTASHGWLAPLLASFEGVTA
ncbi:hypothetical protein PCCS19_16510 [Paenibacillus sp. CCS19]|uniref:ACP S-malonyltransferase n=1 Tax=Paenibacillus sp. CCS19 TaxID=3158387 RepID=UPI002569D669|nr:ACP S-malonyltransferase [Paenibacillus cellulosilyticus]GMK38597.1 hypothetical protein PCCS19_16510 [Paenibacillus cellulosilyticus]